MTSRVAVVPVGGVGTLSFFTQSRPDRFISETLLRGDEWEPFESLVFRRCITADSVCCDVGANLGWYSVIADKLGASVIAFEPDPETFALLQKNLELNSCVGVDAQCFALSDHDGPGLLSLSPDNQGDQRLATSKSDIDRSVIDVPLRRLDDVVANRRINVLKIDTQGAEAAVLRGAGDVLSAGVDALFIEFWPRGLQSCGDEVDDLVEQLAQLGHEIFEFDATDRVLLRTTPAELLTRAGSGRFSAAGGGHLDLLLLAPAMVDCVDDLIRARAAGRPLADSLDPAQRRRVDLAVSCNDTRPIPKVAEAGTVQSFRGTDVQVMHNGVRVVAGGYYGAWQMEIIERLHGHHEPQEESAVHEILQRLARTRGESQPCIVELGAFWSYYALWFLDSIPGGRAVLVEPDPSHLEVLRANLALNDRSATVIQAAIGDSNPNTKFECEDGSQIVVERLTLPDVLDRAEVDRADMVLSDVQGHETEMLESACDVLARRVRFLVVSTHHESISGRRDTHERCLSIIRQCGGHIIAEHTVAESFSGDGLIAASFDAQDRDMRLSISRARTSQSLFAESFELHRHLENVELSLNAAVEYVHALETQQSDLRAQLQRRWSRRRRRT